MSEKFLNLIDILRNRRIELGYSMRELAKEIGTNHSYISDLEHSSSSKIDLDKIIKLCEVLNLDFYDVLVASGYLSNSKRFICYEIDVYFDGTLFYKFDVSELNEERAVDLLSQYLYSHNFITGNEDCKVCFKVRKKQKKTNTKM